MLTPIPLSSKHPEDIQRCLMSWDDYRLYGTILDAQLPRWENNLQFSDWCPWVHADMPPEPEEQILLAAMVDIYGKPRLDWAWLTNIQDNSRRRAYPLHDITPPVLPDLGIDL